MDILLMVLHPFFSCLLPEFSGVRFPIDKEEKVHGKIA